MQSSALTTKTSIIPTTHETNCSDNQFHVFMFQSEQLHRDHYNSHLVHLSHHSIHHFPFKGTEHNGLVLDRIQDKPSAWLDYTCPNVVNCGDCNDETIPAGEV